jgi:hypothetical protein
VSGPDARRREILFAACFVESYLLEWVRDYVLDHEFRVVDKYLPSDDRQGITERWKTVTKMLHADGRIAAQPDYLHSSAWRDFIRLVGFRDGLVHCRIGRPQTGETPRDARPTPTINDLTQMWPGWPTRVVVALVRERELHSSAGTSPPEWLIGQQLRPLRDRRTRTSSSSQPREQEGQRGAVQGLAWSVVSPGWRRAAP